MTGHIDREFQSSVEWDVPLLEGYRWKFFRNYSLKPSLYNGFFGLFNPGMIRSLFREPKSVVVVHGWAYITNVLVIIFARLAGHRVCLRAETPLNQELLNGKGKLFVRKLFFKGLLFKFINKFLFIGQQNKAFYRYLGVPDEKLVFVPYAVDNERFQHAAHRLLPQKKDIRNQLGFSLSAKVILFAAKYIEKKRPLDLLSAYHAISVKDKCLVMVGDGPLRNEMEQFIKTNDVENVILTGFINQSEIEKYYALSDVFVLCSGEGETWGLSANEAMNFNLPVVVSDMAGCSSDLVISEKNGFIFSTGDINTLSNSLTKAVGLKKVNNVARINQYSFAEITRSFKESIIN